MKKLLCLFAIIASVSSCKKEEDDTCPNTNPAAPAITPANNYMKLAAGNYWVYDDYTVDTNNVATYNGFDSSYVAADTMWHGNNYFILHDFYWNPWLRDSSGFIVDTTGRIHFTNQVFNLPVSYYDYPGFGYSSQMTLSALTQVTVPAGTFNSYDWQTHFHYDQPTPWGITDRYAHSYYSNGIGKVKEIYFYASQSSTNERRLNHYHVQ